MGVYQVTRPKRKFGSSVAGRKVIRTREGLSGEVPIILFLLKYKDAGQYEV